MKQIGPQWVRAQFILFLFPFSLVLFPLKNKKLTVEILCKYIIE